jgi:hypothetical protein
MQVPSPLKEIFRRCGDTWDEGIMPLREILIEIFLSQESLGFPSVSLPLYFTDEQIAHHRKDYEVYEEFHQIRKLAKEALDTDDDGWIPSERDLDEMKSRNKMLFEYYVSRIRPGTSPDRVKEMWPFPLNT